MELNFLSAIVTGGSSGLGAAVVTALAEQGCRVSVLDMNMPVHAIAEVSYHACDITDEVAVHTALETATKQNGPPRIVVNCAGLGTNGRVVGREGPLPLEKFRRVLEVNVTGTFNVIRLAAAQLAQAEEIPGFGRGVIINTSSIAAFDGQTGQAAYAASKAAIVGMTLPLAREFAGIAVRVMTICPGLFITPMVADNVGDSVLDGLLANSAYPRRGGAPAEFADLVLSIVRNPMLNGESIRIDGGLRMPTL